MKIVGIIPSRLKSSRVPNKPLIDICGLSLIVHVYKRAKISTILDDVIVATDSIRIVNEIEKHGGKAILTDSSHKNGTERIAEVAKKIEADFFVLINGDEALLNPSYIETSVQTLLKSKDAVTSILVNKFYKNNSVGDFKVVLNIHNEVMYISRNDIPSDARHKPEFLFKAYHILTFRKDFLMKYQKMSRTPMEKIEDHEHLRIIENGYKLVATEVESSAVSLDTYEDLIYIRKKMKDDEFFKIYQKR